MLPLGNDAKINRMNIMSLFRRKREDNAALVRTIVFGVEDSVVSTVGLLSGVAVGNLDKPAIIMTGFILICVEAFSMGVGSFLSESSADDYLEHGNSSVRIPIVDAVIMCFSYLVAGFIVLSPYVAFSVTTALYVSVAVSLAILFMLGFSSSRFSGTNVVRGGIRMVVVGGLALAIGVVVAVIFKQG
jgi:VIT1/CCC1 family predicted Fe2+/Mn2+ transporter